MQSKEKKNEEIMNVVDRCIRYKECTRTAHRSQLTNTVLLLHDEA